MNRYTKCCRHAPALQTGADPADYFYSCSLCGAAGPPAASADKARHLWNTVFDRCVVVDTAAAPRADTGRQRTK